MKHAKAPPSHAKQTRKYLLEEKLPDGRKLQIRAIKPEDKLLLAEGLHHLSPESIYFRFFSKKKEFTEAELTYFTDLDFHAHVGLVASLILDSPGQPEIKPVGVARFIVSKRRANTAEIAFAVDEEYQGIGIGSLLLKQLIKIGKADGLSAFTAMVLPENVKMLAVFAGCGLPMHKRNDDSGVYHVTIKLSPS